MDRLIPIKQRPVSLNSHYTVRFQSYKIIPDFCNRLYNNILHVGLYTKDPLASD